MTLSTVDQGIHDLGRELVQKAAKELVDVCKVYGLPLSEQDSVALVLSFTLEELKDLEKVDGTL